jgi:hypothetical protein
MIEKAFTLMARFSWPCPGLSEEHKGRLDGLEESDESQCREECLDSLSFAEVTNRHSDIPNPHKCTCKWILEQNRLVFKIGAKMATELFWIQGEPGSGKSILLNYLLSEAGTHSGSSQSVARFVFNGRGFRLERCKEGMLRSLLVQLLASFPPNLKLYKQKLLSRDGGQFSGPIW